MNTLTKLRAQRIQPLFDHIARTIELEKGHATAEKADDAHAMASDLFKLGSVLADVPEEYQHAIRAVFRTEVTMILYACTIQVAAIRLLGHSCTRD